MAEKNAYLIVWVKKEEQDKKEAFEPFANTTACDTYVFNEA